MLCKNPFIKEAIAHGCGQCLPCRINKRRLWTTRLLLEAECHQESSFVTLTYAPEKEADLVNFETGLSSLNPDDPTKFIKRLRKELAPHKIRYFLAGEYGNKTERPHYHIALFGYPPCIYSKPRIGTKRVSQETHGDNYWEINQCKCKPCQTIQKKWKYGFTLNGTLSKDSANYVCGYVTKKMTNKNNEEVLEYLNGRYPEYSRMSNRPGIGANGLESIVEFLETEHGAKFMDELGDVPYTIRIAGNIRPLGTYLRRKLREKLKMEETTTPKAMLQKLRKEAIEETWEDHLSGKYEHLRGKTTFYGQKEILIEKNKQKVKNIEKRFKLYNKGETF